MSALRTLTASHNILPYRGIYPRVAARVFIAPSAVVIGDVELGDDASVWFGCVLRADVNAIRVGARSNIQDGTIVHVAKDTVGTYIGADITIGHLELLHACTLEDGCFVGMRSTVMDECVIEAGGMLAAGALLTRGKRIGRGELWAGQPAKYVRPLGEGEIAMMAKLSPRYVGLAADYREAAIGCTDQGGLRP
jgi:carbonic anhydrase/acetyltransferase-like protein (isoleucine patch superfamily)